MIFFNSPYISLQSHRGILINRQVTMQTAADVTGYNIQYLRRLLRSGSFGGIKIGHLWLLEIESSLFPCTIKDKYFRWACLFSKDNIIQSYAGTYRKWRDTIGSQSWIQSSKPDRYSFLSNPVGNLCR